MTYLLYTGTLTGGSQTNATFSLLLPGAVLDLTALNNQRKFRHKGNKAGAKLGWEKAGLGQVKHKKARRGTDMVCMLTSLASTIFT